MSLLGVSIEDVAFELWNGEDDVSSFAEKFLYDYPGFGELWDAETLAKALEDRV